MPRRQLRTRWRALPEEHAERAALKQQVEIAAAIAAELESLLGLGDRCVETHDQSNRHHDFRLQLCLAQAKARRARALLDSISAATVFSQKKRGEIEMFGACTPPGLHKTLSPLYLLNPLPTVL